MPLLLLAAFAFLGSGYAKPAPQTSAAVATPTADAAPLPDTTSLLRDVERNQKRMEAAQRDYTYHVHMEQQELTRDGAVKKTQTEEAESVTVDGVRVDRVVARNGKTLTAEEQAKESERIDKVVAKARERRARSEARGATTDARGDEVLPLSRILELGTFSNPRREPADGRSLIAMDYKGDPAAKTHTPFESIMRDVTGTLWIDETDRVLVRAEGRFQNDFKLGGGLLADVQKGSHFAFRATHVGDEVWLPAAIDGQGSVRVLLLAHFNGRLHVTTSDYRRFRTSATIRGSHGAIDDEGKPRQDGDIQPTNLPSTEPAKGPPEH